MCFWRGVSKPNILWLCVYMCIGLLRAFLECICVYIILRFWMALCVYNSVYI